MSSDPGVTADAMVAKCGPGETKRLDCNTCTCGDDGQFACTAMACVDASSPIPTESGVTPTESGVTPTESGVTPSESGVVIDAPPPTPTESGVVDAKPPAAGCPPKPPTAGQACAGPTSYYCYYFDSETDPCPNAYKCTSGGTGPLSFFPTGENCKVPFALCKNGTLCGPSEACVVTCNRTCTCVMGAVSCSATSCS